MKPPGQPDDVAMRVIFVLLPPSGVAVKTFSPPAAFIFAARSRQSPDAAA